MVSLNNMIFFAALNPSSNLALTTYARLTKNGVYLSEGAFSEESFFDDYRFSQNTSEELRLRFLTVAPKFYYGGG